MTTSAEHLMLQLRAISNPVRYWIVAELHRNGPQYVSELARAAGISRPLLKLHLRKLEEARLVSSETGTAENGKAANFYKAEHFDMRLTPEAIARTNPLPATLKTMNQGDQDERE